jgi:hypothetical protein
MSMRILVCWLLVLVCFAGCGDSGNGRITGTAKAAGAAATTFAISGTKASGRVIGANDRIRLGVAGIRGRGSSHIDAFAKMKDVDVTYLIDPDSRTVRQPREAGRDARRQHAQVRAGHSPSVGGQGTGRGFDRFVQPLALAADVLVVRSGQGRVRREAVQPQRVRGPAVCVASPARTAASCSTARRAAVQQLGAAGGRDRQRQVRQAAGLQGAYASEAALEHRLQGRSKDPPAGTGFQPLARPGPEQPYHENLVHYNWHWFWDFGNGEIGNQGVHQMDIARWAIPGATLPKSVISLGGRWVNEDDFRDQGETPNLQVTVMDFGGPLLVFEVAGLCGKDGKVSGQKIPGRVDNEFYLEAGVIRGGRFYPNGSNAAEPIEANVQMPPGDIFANFIHAMRTRDPKDLHADILEAHYSSACCHLGNISYRLGKEVPGTAAPVGLPDNPQVAESLQLLKTTYWATRTPRRPAKRSAWARSASARCCTSRTCPIS